MPLKVRLELDEDGRLRITVLTPVGVHLPSFDHAEHSAKVLRRLARWSYDLVAYVVEPEIPH